MTCGTPTWLYRRISVLAQDIAALSSCLSRSICASRSLRRGISSADRVNAGLNLCRLGFVGLGLELGFALGLSIGVGVGLEGSGEDQGQG